MTQEVRYSIVALMKSGKELLLDWNQTVKSAEELRETALSLMQNGGARDLSHVAVRWTDVSAVWLRPTTDEDNTYSRVKSCRDR